MATPTQDAPPRSPTREMPDENQAIEWMNPDGAIEAGTYHRGMWFLEGGMHIYYVPTFWRPVSE